jgi:hypothetical protein
VSRYHPTYFEAQERNVCRGTLLVAADRPRFDWRSAAEAVGVTLSASGRTRGVQHVAVRMTDELGDRLRGRRVRTTVEGQDVTGTITAVTYTLKGGEPVLELTLDEATPTGREAVAVAIDDVETV